MPAAVAAGAAAAASGAALLLYLLISCRSQHRPLEAAAEEVGESPLLRQAEAARRSGDEDGEEAWPHRPPDSCCEAAAVAARTARRAWELTVGRWGLHGLAFGIKRHMKRQGNMQHEYSGNDCLQLKDHEAHTELASLLKYLKLCMFYSKKTFSSFLKFGGYSQEDVFIHKARARLMQPSFALVRDKNSKCFLLFIRGAISTKERLTAATSVEVPFHHIILNEGQVGDVILGYAHCGMLAAARWIANLVIPRLSNAIGEFPDYQVKVIGHSMGAGIGAILTYILHEHYEFSSSTCLAFGPAACMTWELAESGKEFITSLVNRDDVVPAFSKVSVESLRSEVMVSSKLDDLQDEAHLNLLEKIGRRVAFVKSHMLSISHSTGKTLNPDSSISEPLLKHSAEITQPEAAGMHTDCSHRLAHIVANTEHDSSSVSIVTLEERIMPANNEDAFCFNPVAGSGFSSQFDVLDNTRALDAEQAPSLTMEEAAAAEALEAEQAPSLTMEEEEAAALEQNCAGKEKQKESPSSSGSRQLFPPGRIIHMVARSAPDRTSGEGSSSGEILGVYETPRDLYSKIRLAPNMIREHYMPSYISTMESLLEQLQKGGGIVSITSSDL